MESIAVVGVLVVGVIAALGSVVMYNGLVRRKLRTDEAWAQVAVALERRHDLVPNLVHAVGGYMGFERAVLTEVTEARAAAVTAGARGPAVGEAEGLLTGALRSLFMVVEAYPELRANENVRSLQERLATTEDMIASARDVYNAAVRDYDTAIARFPASLMAGSMGFRARAFFDAEPAAAQTPTVDLR